VDLPLPPRWRWKYLLAVDRSQPLGLYEVWLDASGLYEDWPLSRKLAAAEQVVAALVEDMAPTRSS
jgi:hypothetical protein